MTNEALQNLISSWIPELEFSEEASQFLNITVQPEQLHQLMLKLKTNDDTYFDYLFCLSGVDWEPELGVVYHLESTKHRHIVVVKVKTRQTGKIQRLIQFVISGKLLNFTNVKCLTFSE